MKRNPVGERPDTSIVVTQDLRRLIARRARAGETVEATLLRLFQAHGHRGFMVAGNSGRMLHKNGGKTTVRLSRPLKSWIVRNMRGYETPEHAIRRLAGLTGRKTSHG